VRRRKVKRRQGQGNQTTINLRDVLLENNASVVPTTTSESHRRDAHGRGFPRKMLKMDGYNSTFSQIIYWTQICRGNVF
jgi:hypothetical protein